MDDVDGGDGAVVPEAVVEDDDGKARDTAGVVEDVKALSVGGRRRWRTLRSCRIRWIKGISRQTSRSCTSTAASDSNSMGVI